LHKLLDMFSKIVIGWSAECHVWVVADSEAHECRLALSAERVFLTSFWLCT